jgi:hypothetical protein
VGQKFAARLFALSRSHDLLTREQWESAGLVDLVNGALGPFGVANGRAERFSITGSDVRLPPKTIRAASRSYSRPATAIMLSGMQLIGLDWGKLGAGSGFVELDARGVVVTLPTSKGSQEEAVEIVIPCPDMPTACDALARWAFVAKLQQGEPVFRWINKGGSIAASRLTDRSVARIVKLRLRKLAIASGRSAADANKLASAFSSHSLALASPPQPPSTMRPAIASRAICATAAWTPQAATSALPSSGPSRGSRGLGSESSGELRLKPIVLTCMWTTPQVIRSPTITLWHTRCRERASSTPSRTDLRRNHTEVKWEEGRAYDL